MHIHSKYLIACESGIYTGKTIDDFEALQDFIYGKIFDK